MDDYHRARRACPRCDLCGKVVRVVGVGLSNVYCAGCLSENMPFVNIESDTNYREALREFREGLGTGMIKFQGDRFDPFGEEERRALKDLDGVLRGCKYTRGGEVAGRQKEMGKKHGCSLSLLFHNIRSARGPGLEMLEAEVREWGVQWDIIGLAETWLDSTSEKYISVKGYTPICASRKHKSGGGVAILLKDGLTYRERTDISVFSEGVFESVFIELIRPGEGRNEIVGVVYRPPGGSINEFNDEIASLLPKLRGLNTYIMGDFNIDLLKAATHRPTADCLEGFYSGGFYPHISLPTRLTESSASLIDNVFTNNILAYMESGLLTVKLSDHLPIYSYISGHRQDNCTQRKEGWHRVINEGRIAGFAEELRAWSFDESRALGVEANVARFRNEFRDLYDSAFPWAKNKKNKRDLEKPWLDDEGFKVLVR